MTTSGLMAISDKLEKIKKGAEKLNATTDELNLTISYIEKQMLGSGVEFWWESEMLAPNIGNADGTAGLREREYHELGYTKIGNDWCLAVRQRVDVEEDTARSGRDDFDECDFHTITCGDPVPLMRAPRRIRIAAADHLEAFLEALADEIDRMTKSVSRANALVTDDAGIDPELKRRIGQDLGKRR